jgi:glucose-6-phosphate 1-dehydrogenase
MNEYLENPLILVIFGITGDLSQRKLLPALYHLAKRHELPEHTKIVGVSRHKVPVTDVYAHLHERIHGSDFDKAVAEQLHDMTEMVQMNLDNIEDYVDFKERLGEVSEQLGSGVSRIYYLSIPAQVFVTVVHNLGKSGHHEPFGLDGERPRLLVEKPFGYDMASAKTLVHAADEHFGEQQTYRIDHYLAKETAQNILTFRFKNPLFQTIWNKKHIASIHVIAHETIGIENRATFYEQTGALRDFIQSHLIQLLALATMEKPEQLDSASIHAEKLRLLESIKTIEPHEVHHLAARGQYDSYKEEVANSASTVETFARLQLTIDNDQWREVPMVVESGKALHEKCSRISVTFRSNPEAVAENVLDFRIQPREGITLSLQAKRPGLDMETETVHMEFDYDRSYGQTADAYERVIVDAIRGDQSLFSSAAEVLSSWRVIENVLQQWAKSDEKLALYPTGSSASAIG